MHFNDKQFRTSSFSIIIFLVFVLVSVFSLYTVRSKILQNSRIMGQEIAAKFTLEETSKIKTQEMLLNIVARNLDRMLSRESSWSDEEIERLLVRYSEYVEKNTDIGHFDLCAVINGRIVGSSTLDAAAGPGSLKWYGEALARPGRVVYSDPYRAGDQESPYILTMAVQLGESRNVLALSMYPERINSLISDRRLPPRSFYYLCDGSGNLLYAVTDRNIGLKEQQPYVDHIFDAIRQGRHEADDSYIVDYEGNKRGVYYAFSDKGWISIVTIPYGYLLEDYETLLQWFTVTLVIMLLFVLLFFYRDRLLNRKFREINDVVQALGNSCFAIFRINYRTGRYKRIRTDSRLCRCLPDSDDYSKMISSIIPYVEKEAASEFAENFALENIRSLAESGAHEFGGDFRQLLGDARKWVNVRIIFDPILDEGEAILCFREADEEKRKELEHLYVTEQALKLAHKNAKTRNMFFSAMSHDMRMPLNGIVGMAELAALHKDDPSSVVEYVEKIKSASSQLLALINDILEVSRMENGHVEHTKEQFDIYAAVREIADLADVQSGMEQKKFSAMLKLQHEFVTGDIHGLRQILNNVLSNAVKYTMADGSIVFTAARGDKNANGTTNYIFTIQDTGCGMSEEFLRKIFTPFEREARFSTRKVSGTGLGMAIVKSLVESMEGSVNIMSKIGEGTCVTVILPFETSGGNGDGEGSQEEAAAPKLSDFAGCRVLVAEDNDINMEIVSELLRHNGLEVLQAENGLRAAELFAESEESSIDYILMDIQMPELDGYQAARKIRQMDRADAAAVPIIALTGNTGAEEEAAAAAAGMSGYLSKPIQMKLLAKVFAGYKDAVRKLR